jgi:hypothetical protein
MAGIKRRWLGYAEDGCQSDEEVVCVRDTTLHFPIFMVAAFFFKRGWADICLCRHTLPLYPNYCKAYDP